MAEERSPGPGALEAALVGLGGDVIVLEALPDGHAVPEAVAAVGGRDPTQGHGAATPQGLVLVQTRAGRELRQREAVGVDRRQDLATTTETSSQ